MSSDKDAGDDWLSVPVGSSARGTVSESTASSTGPTSASTEIPTHGPISESITTSGSKYKSSFTNSLAGSGSLYPSIGSTVVSPSDAPADPGPATSVGLGSAATGTQARIRRAAAGPRRAKLQIRHIDPWSTLKLSLVLAVAFFFVWMVAVGILYGVLSAMGVFESIDSMFSELGGSSGNIITPKVVFGGAALIGAINIVLFTALATIGAYIYNLCADLAGGLEITLAERR